MLAKISSAVFVHTNGLGDSLVMSRYSPNGIFERAGAAVGPPLDLFFRQQREPALNEVEPGRARRREMDVEARMRRHPAVDARRLVRPVVVEDQMEVELGRHARVNRLQELEKLLAAMPPMTFADDGAASPDRARQTARWCRAVDSRACAAPGCRAACGRIGALRSRA